MNELVLRQRISAKSGLSERRLVVGPSINGLEVWFAIRDAQGNIMADLSISPSRALKLAEALRNALQQTPQEIEV